MLNHIQRKITPSHLSRSALLYVRQAMVYQLNQNHESLHPQYALRERAKAWGWPPEQIVVIDCDLGQPGTCTERAGFQRLLNEVSQGRVGIVLSLDTSRLTRNPADVRHLLKLCASTQTLILDQYGWYSPAEDSDYFLLQEVL